METSMVGKDQTESENGSEQKVVYILRGLPGSGRDNLIPSLKSGKTVSVIQANVDNDERDKEKFDIAHRQAFKEFKEAVKSGNTIVVNNSNLRSHHYHHYVDFAQRNDYLVYIVIAPVLHLSDRELAKSANVDELVIRKMRGIFEWEYKKPTWIEDKWANEKHVG